MGWNACVFFDNVWFPTSTIICVRISTCQMCLNVQPPERGSVKLHVVMRTAGRRLYLNVAQNDVLCMECARRLVDVIISRTTRCDGRLGLRSVWSKSGYSSWLRPVDENTHHANCFLLFYISATNNLHSSSRSVSQAVMQSLTVSLVIQRLGCGSAMLAGLTPACQLDRLQAVLNAAARLIHRSRLVRLLLLMLTLCFFFIVFVCHSLSFYWPKLHEAKEISLLFVNSARTPNGVCVAVVQYDCTVQSCDASVALLTRKRL